ncbi:hypothetical protein, partial [Escherichia coli]|uniref:hypothetical protein n=1 Tax=Escherichia coli TaxID=562 RepID=UPI002077256C
MAQLDSRECRQLLNQAMACRTSLEVEHLLAQFRMTQQDAPLVFWRFLLPDRFCFRVLQCAQVFFFLFAFQFYLLLLRLRVFGV